MGVPPDRDSLLFRLYPLIEQPGPVLIQVDITHYSHEISIQ